MRKSLTAVGCVALVALTLGACSSSKKSSSTATTAAAAATTAAPTTAAPTTAAPATTAAPETTTTAAASAQNVTITPATGLTDGQTVHIVGTGYVAGKTYSAVECADKGNATGAGDCNLHVIKVGTADGSGNVTIDFPAAKGPFGSNNIVCSAAQKCLISVANAGSANPTEVATMNITFAG
jgi:hypothetical protein